MGTAALLQRCSEVSSRKELDFEPFEKKEVRPRDFLARMMLSKSWILGELGEVVSRSWINSLNAIKLLDKAVGSIVRILTLGLLQHSRVLLLFMRQALHESIHIKTVKLSTALLLFCWSVQIFSVCVEETREASHKGGPNSIRMEC